MTIGPYLKAAAAELRKAAVARKSEADAMRNEIPRLEHRFRDLHGEVQRMIQQKKLELHNESTDNGRADRAREMASLEADKVRIQQDINKEKERLHASINAIQNEVMMFEQEAQELEKRAGQY